MQVFELCYKWLNDAVRRPRRKQDANLPTWGFTDGRSLTGRIRLPNDCFVEIEAIKADDPFWPISDSVS